MKLSQKTRKHLILLTFLGTIIGTLVWIIIEKIIQLTGVSFSLQTGKIGFDLQVISFYINLNPGTLLGLPLGWLVFRKL